MVIKLCIYSNHLLHIQQRFLTRMYLPKWLLNVVFITMIMYKRILFIQQRFLTSRVTSQYKDFVANHQHMFIISTITNIKSCHGNVMAHQVNEN